MYGELLKYKKDDKYLFWISINRFIAFFGPDSTKKSPLKHRNFILYYIICAI